ncbi:DUF1839 family protein [Methylotenera sp.]|uniref:DUF1839 family protein n=1 Tax=Methylotenera sp. TaxID=2051956 RepID=UPI0024898695|nr:DUF1839 family protein [Methylotenera sp.]MDI1297812.1 DUF1839 family protein [Methylotenera sp.]
MSPVDTSQIFARLPENFVPHVLHLSEKNFRETNCYSDLMIEIVNGLGLNPLACLGYTLAADFEGDQWTFGKPAHHDLERLYGIRIEELSLYRSLTAQLVTQVSRGAIPLLEADAFHLPDTAGIDYRNNHVKTTIGITHIDAAKNVMHYFHNATFAKLEGEDFNGVLAPLNSNNKGYLPPYCEIAKLNQVFKLSEDTLRLRAYDIAASHLRKRPTENPIKAYANAILEHQQTIAADGNDAYHAYTFVAPRQLGASHELGAQFLRWLDGENPHLLEAANAFDGIATLSKSLVLKLARVAHSGRPVDLTSILGDMSVHWEHADQQLRASFTL